MEYDQDDIYVYDDGSTSSDYGKQQLQQQQQFDNWTTDLCDLIEWCVRQLSDRLTVFFVIDGIQTFERDGNDLEDLYDALACLLGVAADSAGVQATVKLIVTSPCRTVEVKECFSDATDYYQENDDGDDLMLYFGALEARGSSEANSRMLQHQLGRDFGH